MQEPELYIVSIHDTEPDRSVLAVDFKHIMAALGSLVNSWRFCITSLDAFGKEGVEELCTAVEDTGGRGVWMSAQELIERANNIDQTIEGDILAFPKEVDSQTVVPSELHLGYFPSSRAVVAMVAVDSSFFEVYAKDVSVRDRLQRSFQDVRSHDPDNYFLKPDSRTEE